VTARRLPPSELPDWPRLMRADLAAAYVGVGRETFENEVEAGVWPKALERDGSGEKRKMRMWDRRELDAAVDRLSMAGKPSRTLGGSPGAWQKSA
jgi:hypothetical protein